jgi:uncharacterized protein YjiS (DUF1127 family)
VSENKDNSDRESTNRLLRVIIALLVRKRNEDALSLKQQIETLDDLGLRPAEMAEILGRSNVHISKELSGIRKRQKKG